MYKNMRTKISQPAKEILEKLYVQDKLRQKDIAKQYNVCERIVNQWLKGYNIPKNTLLKVPPKEELEQLYRNLKSVDKVAKHYDRAMPTISKWLNHHNIEI